ncbi:MAG TPA: hypothetical protein VHP32_08500 [Ignavibacteria bacterium]|nr:hypothetical protein [Ignavibacteria bacterium]
MKYLRILNISLILFFIALSSIASAQNNVIAEVYVDIDKKTITIPKSFAGISIDYESIPYYSGNADKGINQIFIRLLSNLGTYGNGQGVLRISRGSDYSWWNPGGALRPKNIIYDINYDWITVITEIARQSGIKFILGVNFANGDPKLGKDWIFVTSKLFPKGSVIAYEVADSPELFTNKYFYGEDNKSVILKGSGWNFEQFNREYNNYLIRLKEMIDIQALLGGAAFINKDWLANLNQFIELNKEQLNIVTQKIYPLGKTYTHKDIISESTIKNQIELVKEYVAEANDNSLKYRITELNISETGLSNVSNSFYTSLWLTDFLFELATVGVNGVNIHNAGISYANAFNFYWKDNKSIAHVNPIYYGLILFSEATQNSASLLNTEIKTTSNIKAWSSIDSLGTTRITIINKDESAMGKVLISVSGTSSKGELIRLESERLSDSLGVRLAGKTFDATNDGVLSGTYKFESIIPRDDTYEIILPKLSAAMLTIRKDNY